MENAEVLLKRRRNADQTRLAKQALAQERKDSQRVKKNKFVRPESIVAKTLATTREKERIRRVGKVRGDGSDFILRVRGGADDNGTDSEGKPQMQKIAYDGTPQLLLVVRVRGPTAVNIPHKAYKVLQILRLEHLNRGVFFKLTTQTFELLRIVAPYVVIGQPSLSCVRSLVQKRGRVTWQKQDVLLNDNTIVEEALGEHGIICIEDIVHEIASLGPAFKQCCFFLKPFQLSRQVSGFGALQRLKKLELREQEGGRQLSNAAAAPIVEVDIDELVAKMN